MTVPDPTFNYSLHEGVVFITTLWIPTEFWVGAVAAAVAWYGRQVTLTYGPGLLADYLIQATVNFMGNATLGKITGAAIVAPIVTPSLIPWVAAAASCLMFVVAACICNLIQRFIFARLCH
jgi:hypothetical protein